MAKIEDSTPEPDPVDTVPVDGNRERPDVEAGHGYWLCSHNVVIGGPVSPHGTGPRKQESIAL